MNDYVIVKLCTGDQILATLIDEDDHTITILNPIQVKTIPVYIDDVYSESVVTNKYCQYAIDRSFIFNRKDIMFYKPLNDLVTKFYEKLVIAFGEESSIKEVQDPLDHTQEDSEELESIPTKAIKFH